MTEPDRRSERILLFAALLLGVAVRARYILAADFPLNDGGLFYNMIGALQRSHYSLPRFVDYNGAHIPFAYPPLGFYAAALVADGLHLSLLTVLHFLPVAVNTLTILAFYRFARSYLSSRLTLVIALFAFAILPESYVWLIMGGSITRSFGFLFSVLGLNEFYRLYRGPRRWTLAGAILFSGLTILSHLEAAYFLAFSAFLLFLFYGRNRAGVTKSVLAVLGIVAVTSPWWLTVIVYHGLSPFLAAGQTGDSFVAGILSLSLFNLTGEALFPILAVLVLVGVLAAWRCQDRFLPLWMTLLILFDSRGAHIYVTVIFALLIGAGVAEVLLPLLSRQAARVSLPAAGERGGLQAARRATRVASRALLLMLLTLYLPASTTFTAISTDGALTTRDRAAMAWVAHNTPATSRFMVLTDYGRWRGRGLGLGIDTAPGWGADRTSEWFPVLAARTSVATPQGYEWFPGFTERVVSYLEAQRCAERGLDCLATWMRKTGRDFDYVYLAREADDKGQADAGLCCWAVWESLRANQDFSLVYDGPGAIIFARRAAT